MKLFPSLLLSAFLLATSVSGYGQKGINVSSIGASFITTPDIDYRGDKKRTPPVQNWLEIEVEFSYSAASNDPKFLDELKIQMYVYIKTLDKVLTGEVTLMNVGEGKEKRTVMYLAPQTLKFLAEGKSTSPSDVDPVGVQVFYKGQLVAEKSSRGAPSGQWWTSRPQLQGNLLNKNDTPFSPLYWDRYELIKPATR